MINNHLLFAYMYIENLIVSNRTHKYTGKAKRLYLYDFKTAFIVESYGQVLSGNTYAVVAQ